MTTAKGKFGSVTLDGEWLILERTKLSPTGRIHKKVHIADIGPYQLKPATLFTNGYIKFNFVGDVGRRMKLGRQGIRVMYDENAVAFGHKSQVQFQKLAQALEAAMAQVRQR